MSVPDSRRRCKVLLEVRQGTSRVFSGGWAGAPAVPARCFRGASGWAKPYVFTYFWLFGGVWTSKSHMLSEDLGLSGFSSWANTVCLFQKCLASWRLRRKRKPVVFIGSGSFVGVWVRKKHVFIDSWPLVGVWLSQTACFCKVLASRRIWVNKTLCFHWFLASRSLLGEQIQYNRLWHRLVSCKMASRSIV